MPVGLHDIHHEVDEGRSGALVNNGNPQSPLFFIQIICFVE